MPAIPNNRRKTIALESNAAAMRDRRDFQDAPLVQCNILVVDDDSSRRAQVSESLSDMNHEIVEVGSTDEALNMLDRKQIHLVVAELHVPSLGGLGLCEAIRSSQRDRLIPVFIKATEGGEDVEVTAITAGADEFLLGPLRPSALRARIHATLRYRFIMGSLDDAESVLFSMAKSVEDRDPDLGQHCQRLALMSAGLGISMGLPAGDIRTLHRGGYLHDIGKISIPDRILFKAGPLTESEWHIMRSHAVRGERICACSKTLAPVLPIVRHHHEKFDGSGYPDGLRGEEIPLLARILQMADIYDALTTERPYKRAYSPEDSLAIMRDEAKKGWRDPVLLEAFAELLPVFRHPDLIDPTRLSLQSLAASLEQYREQSLRQPTRFARNFSPQ